MTIKAPVLLALGVALAFASVAARADGLILTWPWMPGPSTLRPSAPQPARPPMQPMRERRAEQAQPAIGPGEPDETGRIGPTVQAERGADGRLLPTHRPR